ncbi:hypothetical protein [Thioclava sp.]|uniref:hypothetical protein n=1 Tax=Thioclava sp. TaxID=1933450 RepID=UPI003AA8EB7E
MFHPTHPIKPEHRPIPATELRRGDIVLFRFPIKEDGDLRPKRRPCLVLEKHDIFGETFIELAYGTSAMTRANRGYEIHVRRPEDVLASGLKGPTRFVGSRRISVSLRNPGLSSCATVPRIVGHLAPALNVRFDAVRARIKADADIAEDYRKEQVAHSRVPNKRPRTPDNPIVVERIKAPRILDPLRIHAPR